MGFGEHGGDTAPLDHLSTKLTHLQGWTWGHGVWRTRGGTWGYGKMGSRLWRHSDMGFIKSAIHETNTPLGLDLKLGTGHGGWTWRHETWGKTSGYGDMGTWGLLRHWGMPPPQKEPPRTVRHAC